MADNNTLDKYLQLKMLNLQKGFIAANSGSEGWNVTIIQLYFFFYFLFFCCLLSLMCVTKGFCFPCRVGFLLASLRSYSLFEFKILASIPSWCKLVPAPQWERWSLGAMKVCTFCRFFFQSFLSQQTMHRQRKRQHVGNIGMLLQMAWHLISNYCD